MINGDLCHDVLLESTSQRLGYNKNVYFDTWRTEIREKFIELTGLKKIEQNACPLQVHIESEEVKPDYKQIRFTFESEYGAVVPCYLLIPNTKKEKYPVAITLQGHSTGFHNSIGEPKYENDKKGYPRTAFAVQAVQNGCVALAIEQRGMGERRSWRSYGKDNVYRDRAHMCFIPALRAISIGRTIIGERIWDVSRAIDALKEFSVCDLDKILITGNSGGGTISYYAACYDERIQLSVPSCSFCSYKQSILDIEHCACNYIPDVYNWFEMQDLACLLAPRSLAVITGQVDPIFPIDGVRKAFETVKDIYEHVRAKDCCRIVETPNAHFWSADIVWQTIREEMMRLGW